MILVFTLDSHEHFGPFEDRLAAYRWAMKVGLACYQLVKQPVWKDSLIRRPYE